MREGQRSVCGQGAHPPQVSQTHFEPDVSSNSSRQALEQDDVSSHRMLLDVAPAGGACGQAAGATCPTGQCCSQYNYCGVNDAHCKSGCQPGYGTCASTSSTPTRSTRSIRSTPSTPAPSGCWPASAVAFQGSYTSIVLSESQSWRWNCAGQSRYPGAQILMWWDRAVAEWEQFFIFNQGRGEEVGSGKDNGYFYIHTVMATCAGWECPSLTFHHNGIKVQGDGLQLTASGADAFAIGCDACSNFQVGHYAQGCIIQAPDGRCVNKAYGAGLVPGSCDNADKWDFWA